MGEVFISPKRIKFLLEKNIKKVIYCRIIILDLGCQISFLRVRPHVFCYLPLPSVLLKFINFLYNKKIEN